MGMEELIVQSGRQMTKDITEGWLGTPESRRQDRLDKFNMEQKRLLNQRQGEADKRAQEAHTQKMERDKLIVKELNQAFDKTESEEDRKSLADRFKRQSTHLNGAVITYKQQMAAKNPNALRNLRQTMETNSKLYTGLRDDDDEADKMFMGALDLPDREFMGFVTSVYNGDPTVQKHIRDLEKGQAKKRERVGWVTKRLVKDGVTYEVPFNGFTREWDWSSAKVSEKTPEQKGDVKFEEAAGGFKGKDIAKSQVLLDEIKNTARVMINDIQSAVDHPGMSSVVGAPSLGKLTRYVGGSDEANFQSLHEKIESEAFTQMFEKIKGGGSITEVEGIKATRAFNRLSTALSEKEYRKVAAELINEINRLVAIKERRAGIKETPTPKAISYLRKNNTEENRTYFLDTYGGLPEGI